MNRDDHAILIGITSYPVLSVQGGPLDLKGPENDVDAVEAWLLREDGGGVPPENIRKIKSSQFGAPGANSDQPTVVELQKVLLELHDLSKTRSVPVGRRLYIYASGHGFSPKRHRGCLYAANARTDFGQNIHVSAWLEWFQDAGFFREFVLWMDCCMDRVMQFAPGDPPFPAKNVLTPPGASFVGFAAQRALRAVEVPVPEDGGRMHGVFTWTLLEGLNGAAADMNGRVTGRSLADWLRNAQKHRIPPDDPRKPEMVSKEPEIVKEDVGLIFARGVLPKTYEVSLSFPPEALGREARIWSGAPPRPDRSFMVGPAPTSLQLTPGLHLVEVAEAGLRQGFEVIGTCTVEVTEKGPPVALPQGTPRMFWLTVPAGEPGSEIFVIDSRFVLVDSALDTLRAELPFGLFKAKTRLNRQVTERIMLMDRDDDIGQGKVALMVQSVAPILGTAATHERHADAARTHKDEARRQLLRDPDEGTLTVMARMWSSREGAHAARAPWEGVGVVDADGTLILDLSVQGERQEGRDPLAVHTVTVRPGTYFLRHPGSGPDGKSIVLEQALHVPRSWTVAAHILHRPPAEGDQPPPPRVSVHMWGREEPPPPDIEDRMEKAVESAFLALADERKVLGGEMEELLIGKFLDPMAGILAAHLLLVEVERGTGRSPMLLNEVVRNLRRLVGRSHPDVEALSLRCPDRRLHARGTLRSPPMLQRSWTLLAEASLTRPKLLAPEIWDRVVARRVYPPFLVWAVDPEIRAATRNALAQATWAPLMMPPGPVGLPGPSADMMAASPRVSRRASAPQLASPRLARQRAKELGLPISALEGLARTYAAQAES